MAPFTYSNKDENKFWLSEMGDNAQLIYNALPPDQQRDAQDATAFISRFDTLFNRANQNLTSDQIAPLNRDIRDAILDFREYILRILNMVLRSSYKINFKPVVLNNMISSVDEYNYLLNTFMRGQTPTFDPILQDMFWLPYFATQARYIADNVGYYQTKTRENAFEYARLLNEAYIFSMEIQGLTRVGTADFPIAHEHRQAVDDLLKEFQRFVLNLIPLVQQNRVPGTLSVLYLQRANRMLCYYLTQLAVYSSRTKPECDPYAPRQSIS